MKSTIKIDFDETGNPFLSIFLSDDLSDVRDKLLHKFLNPAANNTNSFYIKGCTPVAKIAVGSGTHYDIYPTNAIMVSADGTEATCNVMSQQEFDKMTRSLVLENTEPYEPETK